MVTVAASAAENWCMFTEQITAERIDVREPVRSPLAADFAAHSQAIDELYATFMAEIAEAARAWTPDVARAEAAQQAQQAQQAPQAPQAAPEVTPVKKRGQHHAETGQMPVILARPALPRPGSVAA